MSQAPIATKLFFHNLRFSGHWNIGLGNGVALMANRDSTSLVKYAVDTHQADKVWERSLPEGMGTVCRKYTLADGHIILRDGNNDPTQVYDGDLHKLQEYSVGKHWLVGTLPLDLRVYVEKTSTDDYQLYVHDDDELHHWTLMPAGELKWSWNLSVCQHPESAYMAVVDKYNKSLDVYNSMGKCVFLLIRKFW